MGNSICAKPVPVDLYRTTEAETPNEDEKRRLMGLVFAHRIIKAPILDLQENVLYGARRKAKSPNPLNNNP